MRTKGFDFQEGRIGESTETSDFETNARQLGDSPPGRGEYALEGMVSELCSLIEFADESIDSLVDVCERPTRFFNLVTLCNEGDATARTIELRISMEPTQGLFDLVAALRTRHVDRESVR